MSCVFDTVIDRRGTGSEKYDFPQENGYRADVLPLWVADMDFRGPECVLQALRNRVDHGIFGYTGPMEDYFRAVEGWFSRRFGWQVERQWLVITPGVVFALSAAVRALTQAGDTVMVQPPVYYPFYSVVERNGRTLVENPLLYRDGRYSIDFEDMERKITEHSVKLFILCSPHNPVCRVWTRQELQRLGEICLRHGVIVIADEIHCDFAFPEHPHTPFLKACPQMADKTLVCTAPSKTFNLAGLQISNIFIPGESLRNAFRQELQRVGYDCPNCMGMVACQAAYEAGEPWLEECKAYMRENLRWLREFLAEHLPQVRLVEPEGTYFAWLDCSGLGLTPRQLDAWIAERANVWLDSGRIFGDCAAQFQRVVLACPRQTLENAMLRILTAWNEQ